MNAAIVCGGYFLAKKIVDARNTKALIISWALISYAAIVIECTLLGALKQLGIKQLLAGSCAFFIVALVLSLFIKKRNGLSEPLSEVPQKDSYIFAVVPALLALPAIFIVFVWGVISPPPPWDAFVYHLPFPATWLQQGGISLITVPFGDQAGTYFPSNTELYFLWLMAPFRSEFLTSAGQFPFYLLIGLIIYSFSRDNGCGRGAALASCCIAMLIPGIMHQSVAAEVDVIFAALFLTSLYFLMRYARDAHPHDAALSGLAAGLFIGTKYIGTTFALLLFIPAFFFFVKNRRLAHAILFFLLAVLGGGFWYVRNWVVTGNLIFPLSMSLFGFEIFHGGYTRESMLYSLFHAKTIGQWLSAVVHTTGKPLGILLVISMAVAPFASLLHKRTDKSRHFFFSLVPIIMIAMFALVIPYNLESRFTYAAWCLACIPLAKFIDHENPFVRILTGTAVAAAAICSTITNEFLMTRARMFFDMFFIPGFSGYNDLLIQLGPPARITGAAAALLLSTGLLYMVYRRNRSVLKAALCVVSGLAAVYIFCVALLAIPPAYKTYRLSYRPDFALGVGWQAMDKILGDRPANIAYTGTDLCFGLFGAKLQNRVYSVPVHRHTDWKFHDCLRDVKSRGAYQLPKTDRIDFCRKNPDPMAWINNLRQEDTDFVFISRLHPNDAPHLDHDEQFFPVEKIWADQNPGVFTRIYSNPHVVIYLMNKQP